MNPRQYENLNSEERVQLLDVAYNPVLKKCIQLSIEEAEREILELNPTGFDDAEFKKEFRIINERKLIYRNFQSFLASIELHFKQLQDDNS